jgi:hypothetical protein
MLVTFVVDYQDWDLTNLAFTPGVAFGAFTGTSPVTLCPAPAAGFSRTITNLYIYNPDTSSHTFSLSHLHVTTSVLRQAPVTLPTLTGWSLVELEYLKGETGAAGPKGDTGADGAKGNQGDTGAAGAKGDKGDTGETGAAGPKGDTGAAGAKGDTGETGAKGDKGDTGETGAKGDKGDKGDTGETGGSGGGGTACAVSVNVTDAMWQTGCVLIPAVAGKSIVIVGIQIISVVQFSSSGLMGYAPIRDDLSGMDLFGIMTGSGNNGGGATFSWCCYGATNTPPTQLTGTVGSSIWLVAQPTINSIDSSTLIQLIYILQ